MKILSVRVFLYPQTKKHDPNAARVLDRVFMVICNSYPKDIDARVLIDRYRSKRPEFWFGYVSGHLARGT